MSSLLVDLEKSQVSSSYRDPFELKFLPSTINSTRQHPAKNQLKLLSTTPRTNIPYLFLI